MFGLGGKKNLTIYDAEQKIRVRNTSLSADDLRGKVQIVAIDDEGFVAEQNLSNTGFKIRTLPDVHRITDVEDYLIILCDVNGVGTSLSVETQGAYLIQEIKNKYPDKVVIAYTAGSRHSNIVLKARRVADEYMIKDASIDEWRDLLDVQIRNLCDPIYVWKKTRLRLMEAGIELADLQELEQEVLRNLDAGRVEVKASVEQKIKKLNTGQGAWKGEAAKFLVSKAFDLAFEYATK